MKDVLWRRITRLSPAARRLLEVIAVRGVPIEERLCFNLAETGTAGPSLLAQLRSSLLVRAVRSGADGRVACYHDQITETIHDRLDEATRSVHHVRLSQTLLGESDLNLQELQDQLVEAAGGKGTVVGIGTLSVHTSISEAMFDIAVHYDAAGQSEQALPFASAAASRAHRQFSLETAEHQYRIAERGAATVVSASTLPARWATC